MQVSVTVVEAIIALFPGKYKRCSEITLTGGDIVIASDEKSYESVENSKW